MTKLLQYAIGLGQCWHVQEFVVDIIIVIIKTTILIQILSAPGCVCAGYNQYNLLYLIRKGFCCPLVLDFCVLKRCDVMVAFVYMRPQRKSIGIAAHGRDCIVFG